MFNKFLESKYSKIIAFIILDILALAGSSYFALELRFDFSSIPNEYLNNIIIYFAFDVIILLLIFSIFKLYLSMWKFASINESINATLACFFTILIEFFYKSIFSISLPRSYYLIKLILFTIVIILIRFSYRITKTIIDNKLVRKNKINTMIIGAGSASRSLISEIQNNPYGFKNNIICAIDDDKNKIGTYIMEIPVVGNRNKIIYYCEEYGIEEIIIAMPSISKEKLGKFIDICQKTKCEIKILPKVFETIEKPSMKEIRTLSYEDFLGRNEIVVDGTEIANMIEDKTVLVTGGGGSIGSELCRQVAENNPKQLIIFDIYENNAYEIEQELIRNYPNLNLKTIIGSVRDYDRVEDVFKTYRPNQVYHAAAHKHVPLMELSPNEAIKNNCLGTLNVVKLADKYCVDKFVLVSTDKAVRPTNVMGATKRICEMIIQAYSKKSKHTDYVAVRFGNVLGSNGSVIPLFLKQIESGGPVTVTHKDITRYFMTIHEAVSLILQAGVYAKGGEIFVLDMGESVKIYNLAERIIRYKGLEPGIDIKIVITGLRPGEKLHEELLMDEEGLKKTKNKLIYIGEPLKFDDKKFFRNLDKLIDKAYENGNSIKKELAKVVETYTIDEGVNKNEK